MNFSDVPHRPYQYQTQQQKPNNEYHQPTHQTPNQPDASKLHHNPYVQGAAYHMQPHLQQSYPQDACSIKMVCAYYRYI